MSSVKTKLLLLLFFMIENSNSTPSRLKKDLLADYDPTVRPVLNHKNSTSVTIRIILKFFQLSIHSNSFDVDSWLALVWKDEYLKWNPDDYSSVKSLHFSNSEIWMPDISVYNRNVQSGSPLAIDTASCIVSYTGIVVCVPPSRQSSLCVADLTKYPFDKQNCTVRIGSWVHSGEEIDFKLAKPPISTEDLIPNGDWKIISIKAIKHDGKYKCCPNDSYPSLNYNFYIQRLSGAHAASVILPAVALLIITLTSLAMSPEDSSRLHLCYINLICHFLYSQYISWMLPLNGNQVPLIVLFGRDSTLLCVFALIFSIILKNMVQNNKFAPHWISNVVSFLIGCRPGQIILLNDYTTKGVASAKMEEDGTTIINSESNLNNQDWLIFAKILDRLCFFIYVIVYTCMFFAFAP